MSAPLKLAIAGAGGRMGHALIEAAASDAQLSVAVALEASGSPALGTAAGATTVISDLAALASAECLVDFTRPAGTLAHLEACLGSGTSMVIGTTGFSEAERARIRDAATRIPIVMAANFAVGVNALYTLAETAARILGPEFDVEIIEAHHRHKVDAPSGTALALGERIARARGQDLAKVAVHGRHGETGERPATAIGFHAIRGGDIVGEHTVLFAGAGERIEVTVRSSSRLTYASGALRAAKWLRGRGPGLYGMQDVLGIG
jgi:4-hydroxy-tetrahydrodipicolinate reductase